MTLANLAERPFLWDKLLPVMLLGTVSTAQYASTVTATPFVEVFYHGISFCLLGFTALKYGAPRAGLAVLAVMGWISYWGLGHLACGHPFRGHGGLAVLIFVGYALFYGLQCVAGPIFSQNLGLRPYPKIPPTLMWTCLGTPPRCAIPFGYRCLWFSLWRACSASIRRNSHGLVGFGVGGCVALGQGRP